MNFLTTVKGAALKAGNRIIKVLRLGLHDVQEVSESSPFGVDGSPLDSMVAVYAETLSGEDPVIIGYLNANQVAGRGEVRLYSLGGGGDQKFYIWLKNDGSCEIGGNSDNMVRYSKLEQAFNQLRSDFNEHVSNYNSHIHPGGTISGNTGNTANTSTPSGADISPAKIEQIKTL